jgi:hypothetical protein
MYELETRLPISLLFLAAWGLEWQRLRLTIQFGGLML